MIPLKLDIENFYCHSKSVINFDDFSAAVIIGKTNGNDKFANGTGKSTIFSAIKYVLFNEVDTSSLEKIIKNGSDSCRVSFEFQSPLDNKIYKIARFRGRKVSAEVRLFCKNNETWDDLTQRTSTETDKEIIKLLKINYKTFSNSVLFAQRDISGIADMTPRERKTALKEALQLSIYSKYESLVKKKAAELTKEIEKTQTIISTIGDPDAEIPALKLKIEDIIINKQLLISTIENIENNILDLNKELNLNQNEFDDLNNKTLLLNKSILEIERDIKLISANINKYKLKLAESDNVELSSFNKAKSLSQDIKTLKSLSFRSDEVIKKEIDLLRTKILDNQSELKQLRSKHNDLKIPLSDDAICKHCRQVVDPNAKLECQKAIDLEIKETVSKINELFIWGSSFQTDILSLEKELEIARNKQLELKTKQFELDREKKSVIDLSSVSKEFKEILSSQEMELNQKQEQYNNLLSSKNNDSLNDKETKLKYFILELKKYLNTKIANKKENEKLLLDYSNEEAVLLHKIKQKNQDIVKISELKKSLNELEYRFTLHQKVLTAFGPNGIPALITNTVLNDYQVESNNFLDKLRPGLRLQFITENEKNDGEMSDTLDIVYYLNNTEFEFSQLSGAQKSLVSLALRLGLSAVISKKIGVDIKMILIDEVDQAFDEAAIETFEQLIKEMQKDRKVLLITHSPDFKTKFSHAIVVEQDSKLNSTSKVSNEW